MNKNLFLFLISLLATPFIWYNLSTKGILRTGVAEGQAERRFGEETVACTAEIPIGEAIEEAWIFACQFSRALSNIQQASFQYRQTVEEITELARQCSANSCLPNCVSKTLTNDNGTPDDPNDDFEETICVAQACSGDPCLNRAEIENKYAKLANISRILAKEQATVNLLLDTKRPEIRKKLDEARRLFERHAPTTEQYQLLRGPTTCKIAVNNFWVELEDVQKGLVCKSPYNYLVCR